MVIKNMGRFLIVDNEQDEINDLVQVLNGINVNPQQHLYSQDETVQNQYSDCRVVFFDVNITAITVSSKGGDNSALFGHLVTAIKDVISVESIHYVLIFWTKHHEIVDDFKKYIATRDKLSSFPHPTHILSLDKVKFKDSQNPEQLIQEKLEKTIFYQLSIFKEIVRNKADELVNDLINIACEPSKKIWKENTLQHFLRALAIGHSGYEIAKDNPSKSLTQALIPILSYKIEKSATTNNIWNALLDMQNTQKRVASKFSDHTNRAKINSLFNIDFSVCDINARGVVIKINDPQSFFNKKFNINTQNTVIADTLLEFPKGSRSKVDFVLVEISSACDFSQNKSRLTKYIVGLKMPKNCYQFYMEKLKTKFSRMRQSVIDLESSFFDETNQTEFNLLLNKNYVLTLNHDEINDLMCLFTFKKEMMDMIGNQYANHISRIGVTSF